MKSKNQQVREHKKAPAYHEVVRKHSDTSNLQIGFVKKAINVLNTPDDPWASF